jgi:hypothetical protein
VVNPIWTSNLARAAAPINPLTNADTLQTNIDGFSEHHIHFAAIDSRKHEYRACKNDDCRNYIIVVFPGLFQ